MASLPVLIDPTTQASGTELAINDGSGYVLHAPPDLSPPAVKVLYASSFDTEGSIPADEARFENRQIGLKVRVYGTSEDDLEAKLGALHSKVGKLNRQGGTLLITFPSDTELVYDLLPEATGGATLDEKYLRNHRCDVELRLAAKPFGRRASRAYAAETETTDPCLIFDVEDVGGDVAALGSLLIDLTAEDLWKLWIGVEPDRAAAATAALYIAGTDLTPLGASTDTGTAIRNTDLTSTWQAIASTGTLTHVAPDGLCELVRLYRPASNTGEVSVKAEWQVGDGPWHKGGRITTYAANDREGVFTLADLDVAYIPEAVVGSQEWELRILAKSTVTGDEIDVAALTHVPAHVYAAIAPTLQFDTPSTFSARDEFNQVVSGGSDPLTGLTLPVGGTWVGAGDTDDFVVEDTGHTAQRTAVNDASGTGRWALAGTTVYAATTVQVDFKFSVDVGGLLAPKLVARYVDTSNALYLWPIINQPYVDIPYAHRWALDLYKYVAGTPTRIAHVGVNYPLLAGTWYTMRLVVDAAGRAFGWFWPTGSPPPHAPLLAVQDSALATGGALDDGRVGFYDEYTSASAVTRNYKNFLAFPPTADAACFASQSLVYSHGGAFRENAAGTQWAEKTVSGRNLYIPCSGAEGRTPRVIVMGSQHDPETMPHAFGDLRATLTVTERYLGVPGA